MAVRAVIVSSTGDEKLFKWFQGTSLDTVLESVSRGFGTPQDACVSLCRASGEPLTAFTNLSSSETHELLLDVTLAPQGPAYSVTGPAHAAKQDSRPPTPRRASSADPAPSEEDEQLPLLSREPEAHQSTSEEATHRSWLKLKRILAHLANERTFLAWIRVASKVFVIAMLCVQLATKKAALRTEYAVVGAVYVAICPQIVLLAARRYGRAREAMGGSVHDCYDSFRDGDLKEVGTALALLVLATLVLLIVAQLSS